MNRLILVRHGETLHNVAGIAQGWSDSDLSDRGREQVRHLAVRLRSFAPSALFTSTLPRALTTAAAISEVTGLAARPLELLREMHCGSWEGNDFMKVRAADPEYYRRWISDPTVPCPEGESFADVQQRLRKAFAFIGAPENGAGRTAVVVSHGTAIRIAAIELLGLPLSAARSFQQDNAALNIFERHGDRYVLRVWNDATHCPLADD